MPGASTSTPTSSSASNITIAASTTATTTSSITPTITTANTTSSSSSTPAEEIVPIPSTENRAAVLLAMVQALSVQQGYDCLGSESDRLRLANMGPEERFRALQIEFVALTYRLETREMELRGTRARLEEANHELDALRRLQSVESKQAFEEEVIAEYLRTHAEEALELQTALERGRQKLRSAIDADLLQHIPKPRAVTLDDLLLAAGLRPKDSSTRSRLRTLLAEHMEKRAIYSADEAGAMVLKIQAFAKEHAAEFSAVGKSESAISATLPWSSSCGNKKEDESQEKKRKKKHPVDKVWDSALDALDRYCCRAKR